MSCHLKTAAKSLCTMEFKPDQDKGQVQNTTVAPVARSTKPLNNLRRIAFL